MKFLVVVVAFLSVAVLNIRSEFTEEVAITIATSCKEETGASDADFETMFKHQPAETKEGKCLRACSLKKFGAMSDEGKMVKDASIELAKHFIREEEKKDLAVAIIEACEGSEVSEDHCEAAEQYGECVKAEFANNGLGSSEDL